MIIFGAGASYDSLARMPPETGGEMQWRPPLANQLFDSRWGPYIQQFPQAHAVIPELERGDVEATLERYQVEAETEYPKRRIQLMAIRFYLQLMLTSCEDYWGSVTRGVTNYKALLDRIEHRVRGEKILVSFNHDTLLEDALSSTADVKIRSIRDYLSSDYKVVKPHGSINWVHRVTVPRSTMTLSNPSDIIDMTPELQIFPDFEVVPRNTLGRGQSPLAPVPALSIPVVNKSSYECPTEQEETLVRSLPKVDKVIVIGWRAAENRFLDSFASHIAKKVRILVISSGEQHAGLTITKIDSRLRQNGVTTDYVAGKRGFSHSIVAHEADDFLKS